MGFWILWGIDAVIAVVFLGFFIAGIADGSVSSFNAGLWIVILAALGALLWGGYALRAAGRSGLATKLLMLLAVPAILIGALFVVVLVSNPRWN